MESLIKERIKELRMYYNMTQEELAEKIGVSRVTITRYENGERSPDFYTLLELSLLFKVDTDYLLGKTNFKNHEELELSELKELLYNSYTCPKISQTNIIGKISESLYFILNDSIRNDNYELLKNTYILFDLIDALFDILKLNLMNKENSPLGDDYKNYTDKNTKEILCQIKNEFSNAVDYLSSNFSKIYHNSNDDIKEILMEDMLSFRLFLKYRSVKDDDNAHLNESEDTSND